MRKLDHKSLSALLLVITRMIKADSRVDAEEIEQLSKLEEQYGFDRTLMAEAARMTLAEAICKLTELDETARLQIMQSLTTLAKTDRMLERHEALLLIALRYCLEGKEGCEVLSGNSERHSGDLGSYIIYHETAFDQQRHQQMEENWELLTLLLQQHGLQLMMVEQIVKELCQQDDTMIRKLMGYMAPALNDAQLDSLYERMTKMDTVTFSQRVLVRDLEYATLRDAKPSLLLSLGHGDLLRIELRTDVLTHVRQLLADYSQLASPSTEALRIIDNTCQPGHFRFYGFYHDFFSLIVESEPMMSRIVVWPNRSEFDFPEAGRTLKLNQQEASLYCLILHCSYTGDKKGLPLSYTPQQRQLEALYRTIYCRKKLVDTKDVIFPDPLAPIRAKIERKMREQLVGLDNLEDFIPYNINREGYYRVQAPAHLIKLRPDYRQPETDFTDYTW